MVVHVGNNQGFNSMLRCWNPNIGGGAAVVQVVGNEVMIITAIMGVADIIPTKWALRS